MNQRFIFGIILTILFTLSIYSQTGAVQITGGRIFIDGNNLGGTGEIRTAEFTALSQFIASDSSFWETDCFSVGCRPGASFVVPGAYAFANTYRSVSFAMNDTVYAGSEQIADGLTLSANSFIIPKVARRKGLLTLRQPFTFGGRFKVCRLTAGVSPCPVGELLFDKNITGHGILTITGRLERRFNDAAPRWYIESFEYIFNP